MGTKNISPAEAGTTGTGRKSYLSQSDVPRHTLKDAIRVARALADHFGKSPTKPLLVAQSLGLSPTSSTFRMLTGASIGYDLTEGGYNANVITLTPLGARAVAPQDEGDDELAMREAFRRPRIINEFLTKYQNSKLPPEHIARNVLEGMGIPADSSARVFEVIKKGAEELGLLRDIKGATYVDVETTRPIGANQPGPETVESPDLFQTDRGRNGAPAPRVAPRTAAIPDSPDHRTFAIPLMGGRTGAIQLPLAIGQSDIQRIKQWIDLMSDVLTEPAFEASKNKTGSIPEDAPSVLSKQRRDSEE